MMYKLGVLLVLLILFIQPREIHEVEASVLFGLEQQEEEKQQEEEIDVAVAKTDILLLHNAILTETERENLQRLSDMATSLVKRMEFGTVEEYEDVIEQYDAVICFHLSEEDTGLAKRLASSESKIMILGSEFMKQFLEETGQSSLIGEEEVHLNGVFQYTFSGIHEFEQLIRLDKLYDFRYQEEGTGNITIEKSSIPFSSILGGVTFIPVTDFSENLTYSAMMREMISWLWIYNDEPTEYTQYIVLDAVYAYMPAVELKEKVDVLIDNEIPFVISVMPVFKNTQYPAMQQFCEVLQYAQENNSAVILHMPILNDIVSDWDVYNELITNTLEAYNSYSVYPLGIEIGHSWIYNEEILNWLKRYRTVFVYEDERESDFTEESHVNLIYDNYHHLIMPSIPLDDTNTSYVKNYSSALYLDCSSMDTKELKENIESYLSAGTTTKSLWKISHSVWADSYHMAYENGVLSVNDEIRSLEYIPQDYEEDYEYKRNILQRVTLDLENQSNGLIYLVTVVIVLFLMMIAYARYQNRRRFLGKKIKEKDR